MKAEESLFSSVLDNYKSNGNIDLKKFKCEILTEEIRSRYKTKNPYLKHVDTKKHKGLIYFDDNNNIVAFLSIRPNPYQNDSEKNIWIESIYINPEYRGYHLTRQILDICTKKYGANALGVNKKNEIAIRAYQNYGFEIFQENEKNYLMKLKNTAKEGYFSDLDIQEKEFDEILAWAEEGFIKDYIKGYKILNEEELDHKNYALFFDRRPSYYDLTVITNKLKKRLSSKYEKIIDLNFDNILENDPETTLENEFIKFIKGTSKDISLDYDKLSKLFIENKFKSREDRSNFLIICLCLFYKFTELDENKSIFIIVYSRLMLDNLKTIHDIEKIPIIINRPTLKEFFNIFKEINDTYKQKAEMFKDYNKDKSIFDNRLSSKKLRKMNLYHLSTNPNIINMEPRVTNNTALFENKATKRISFSTSIEGCLRAMPYQDIIKEKLKLYVYSPIIENSTEGFIPSNIQVFDASYTNEIWILTPVKVKQIGIIEITDSINKTYNIISGELKYANEGYFSDLDIQRKEFDDTASQMGFVDPRRNRWNSLIKIDNKNYRERCEVLIIKDNKVFLAKKGNEYRVPGGSTEPDKPISTQAIREVQEEAHINIKNVRYYMSYIVKMDKNLLNQLQKEFKEEWKAVGTYNHLFVADYDGKYTGKVESVDKDPFIYNNGKFYEIDKVINYVKPEFKFVLDSISNKNEDNHFYFYHFAPKNINNKIGILSPKYMYEHNMNDLFKRSTDKYRDRLVNAWGYYKDKNPEELTDKEIFDGINKFRKSDSGLSYIYFFKYPPYENLGPKMKAFLKTHDCYRIDLNDPDVKRYIDEIYWGTDMSHSDSKKLDEEFYRNISFDDYFKKYNDSSKLNFAALNHIAIRFKDDYCPIYLLRKIDNVYMNALSYVNESFLFSKKDMHFNVEKWGTEVQYNILWITGLSGSGKSTLSEEYANDKNTEIIHLDEVMYNFDKKYWFNQYLSTRIPNYNEIITKYKNDGKMIMPVKQKLWNDIINEIISYSEELFKKKKKLVVEGLQIIIDIAPGYIDNRPLIIKGTSVIKSIIRALKRDGLKEYVLENASLKDLLIGLREIFIKWKVDDKRMNALSYDNKKWNKFYAKEALGVIGDSKHIIDNFSSLFNISSLNRVTKNLLSIHDNIKSFDISSLFTKVNVKNHRIEIEGINFRRLLLRMEETYGSKKILNILGKEYSKYDEYLFKAKRTTRSKMRITKFVVHEFFALELFNILAELEDRYNDSNYRKICGILLKKTWIGNIGKAQIDKLDIKRLNNLSYTLQPYQKEFIQNYPLLKNILGLNGHILAFEQGLGKTLTSISLAECMGKEKVYILCPNKLTGNWADEIKAYYKKYSDDEVFYNEVCILNNNKFKITDKTRFIITNYENIKGMLNYAEECDNMLIIDESHNFRNLNGSRVKELLNLKDTLKCKDILLCSGTPIKAIPSEIVPSLLMIDPIFDMEAAEIFVKCFNINSTAASNIVKTRFGYVMYRKDKSELKLPEKFIINMKVKLKNPDKYSLKSVKSDISSRYREIFEKKCEDIKEKKDRYVYFLENYSNAPISTYRSYYKNKVAPVETGEFPEIHEYDKELLENFEKKYLIQNIPKDQMKEFKKARTEYMFIVESAVGTALGEILPKRRTEMYISMYEENKQKFINIIENNDKKVVIFSQFKKVVDYICDDLNNCGIGAVKITGNVKNAHETIKRFKEDGAIDVIVATTHSMGTGHTLIEANKMFFFGAPWRSTDFDQCCDRIHRMGQTTPVYIHNVTLDTDFKNLSSRMRDILNWSDDMFSGYITDNLKEDVEKITTESYNATDVVDSFAILENKFNTISIENFSNSGEEIFLNSIKDIFINIPIQEEYALEEANYSDTNKYPVFVVLMHSGTVLANIIKKVTNDQFSHACISFNSKLNPLYSFGRKKIDSDPGFAINNPKTDFYQKFKTKYSVYVIFVTNHELKTMKKKLKYFIDNQDKLKYDLFGLVFNYLNLTTNSKKSYFCSRFVAEIIGSVKNLDMHPSLYRPQDLSYLPEASLLVEGDDISKYDYRKTDLILRKYIK